MSFTAAAQDAKTATHLIDISKIAVAAISIVLAPYVTQFIKDYFARKSFRIFLRAHSRSTLTDFGEDYSVSISQKLIVDGPDVYQEEWLETLDKANVGVPIMLIDMAKAIQLAKTNESHKKGYIPFLSYIGVNNNYSPLEHESIIWSLNKPHTKAAARYFISQEQVSSSIKQLYDPLYLELIKSDDIEQRKRWCNAANMALNDLACHYINCLKLRGVLEANKYY